MMNHCVPDFGIGEDDPFSSALGFANRKIIPDSGNELAEILWQKGPVLRKFRSDDLPCPPDDVNGSAAGAGMLPHAPAPMEAAAGGEFFMGEDEMASWLHYTNGDMGGEDAGSSLQWAELDRRPVTPLPEAPGWPLQQQGSQGSALPPLPATRPPEGMNRVGASRESTVVGSNMTPGTMSTEPLPPDSRMSTMAATREGARTYENMTVTSSSGGGGGGSGSGSGERTAHVADDRKRKARELDDSDGEEGEYDSDDKKKDARRPTRRTRAAEVHNLSERRRRDRINEKMKALQQLIPRCNKSDKASMLDDAVEYLKSLQLQIKVMSMGCTMPPMMYAGIPQYAAQMGTATGMNTNSGCVAHPMLPFMPVMQGSPIPGPTAANLGARMPMQAFHPASMAVNGHLRGQTPGQRDPAANAMCLQGQNPMQVLNTPDYYRQFYSLQQMQLLQDAGKVPNSPEKLDSSKPSCST